MNVLKSKKGSFTILSVLISALFVEFLLLNLHKNINSFMEMEKKQKEQLSKGKLKQMIIHSLSNEKACGKTFKKTNQDVTSIKSFDWEPNEPNKRLILDFSVSGEDFYEESGFYEKTALRVKSIKIIEEPPENYKDGKKIKNLSLASPYEHPKNSGEFHSVATLKMAFSKFQKDFSAYAPIFITKKSGRIQTCSTSKRATQKLTCEKQSITVTCCRYIYKLTFDPESYPGKKIPLGKSKTKKARPGDELGFTETKDDPGKTQVVSDCQGEKTVAQATGTCDFEYNWILEAECILP